MSWLESNGGDADMPVDGPGHLTLRTASSGGSLRDAVREVHGSPRGVRRFGLFIHGYANSHDVACRSYEKMWQLLADNGVSRAVLNEMYFVYWPGDEALPGWSQATYAQKVGVAQQGGILLAEYLRALQADSSDPIEVVLVAHSLGNRVAMEALRSLEWPAIPGEVVPHIIGMVLMAAAVGTHHMSGNSARFSSRSALRREYVLFSLRDGVLKWAFPAGQTIATILNLDSGWFPEAVGRKGQPTLRWTHASETGYTHGGYWKGAYAGSQVTRLFGKFPARRPAESAILQWELEELGLGSLKLDERLPGGLCGGSAASIYY